MLILIVDWLPRLKGRSRCGQSPSNCDTGGFKALYGRMTGKRTVRIKTAHGTSGQILQSWRVIMRHTEKAGASP